MREIKTKRLLLRKLRSDDAESIFKNWASDSEVAKYVTWNVHKDINETKAILDMSISQSLDDRCKSSVNLFIGQGTVIITEIP